MKKTSATKNETSPARSLVLGLALAAMLSSHSAIAGGTDILRLNSKTDMVNTGIEPNAGGQMDVTITRQGNAYHQKLNLSLTKLHASTAYGLVVYLGDDTNSTSVTNFTTSSKGDFTFAYV